MKKYLKKHYPLVLSFWTPVLLMLGYFIYRGFYPFGSSSVLTVDLGQQYVDFFAYFRHTLLHSPNELFYSFSKALGGPMIGEVAYYLLSPFNLLFVFFPGKYLSAGCLLILLLKYGCASYTFGRLLKNELKLSKWMIPALATSYALMGWMIANQLNMLWLDAPIFLPLIISALYRLLQKKRSLAYVLWLASIMIINYYMAYMICLFLILFFAWYQTAYFSGLKKFWSQLYLFISRSLLAAGVSALVLVPTYYSLVASKGQYIQKSFQLHFEYAPLKMLSKFVIGAFNFEQMPEGFPNLFIGSLALIGAILYFISLKIKWRPKLAAFLVSAFLWLSLCFEPLDLLWHGMQFPVWYPYRFSFIVSFWMIFLAALALEEARFRLAPHQALICLVIFTAGSGYVYFNSKGFDYISEQVLLFTALFNVLLLLVLTVKQTPLNQQLTPIVIFLLVCFEMLANTAYSLNNISYLTQAEFAGPTKVIAQDQKKLTQLDPGFYRTAQLYSRTKDDGLAHDLKTGSYFSSALEKSIPDLYGQLGQPEGDNYVGYYNGTLISDSLLNMQYFLQAKDNAELDLRSSDKVDLNVTSYRPDTKLYSLRAQTGQTRIYQNPYTIGLGYSADKKLKQLKVLYDHPLTYQTNWLNAATGATNTTKYFYATNFNEVVFQNTKKQTNLTGAFFKKSDLAKPAQIIFKFTPETDDPYYLTLGASLDGDSATWYLGSKEYPYYKTFRHTIVLNPTVSGSDDEVVITAKFKKTSLWLENFVLYRMDRSLVEQKLKQLQKNSWQLTKATAHRLTGTIDIIKSDQFFATTIPYSKGWQAKVDGKTVKTYKIQDAFVGFDISQGKHQVTLTFTPPGLYLGIILSLISLVLVFTLRSRETKA